MAERRMFAKTIVLSDAFLDMPMSARCLYFTLGMFADDDGFVNTPKSIMRQCGASADDMQILIAKKFVLVFDSGVIVIKHWRINNYLRADRYTPTKYTEEKAELEVKENGAYRLGIPDGIPVGIPSIDKDRLDKNSISNNNGAQPIPEIIPDDIQPIIDKWNSVPCTVNIMKISPGTRRWDETRIVINMYGIDNVLKAIDKISESEYLSKRGGVVYDRFMNRDAIQNVLEGTYDKDLSKKPAIDYDEVEWK